MDVLFLNPPRFNGKNLSIDPVLVRCSGVPAKAPYMWPPIGLAYLAAFARENSDAKINILDAQAEGFSEEKTIEAASKYNLVLFNTSTVTSERDLGMCKKISRNGSKIALLGGYAEIFRRELIEREGVDFVVFGEPEGPIANLLNALEKEKPEDARGIVWKKKNKIVENEKDKPFKNLDSLPFAARNLLPEKKYYDVLSWEKNFAFAISSRGCPFNCHFCSTGLRNTYRERSAENVLEEMEQIADSGIRDMTFFDDSFTINKDRVAKISKGMEKLDVVWRCLSRVDTVDRKMLEGMAKGGCYQAWFGIESGSREMLARMGKDHTLEQARNAIKDCDRAGIESVAFFVLGFPGETQDSLKKTIGFSEEIGADFATFNLFAPMPGSLSFKEKDYSNESFSDFDFNSKSFCSIPTQKLLQERNRAYREFYFRPGLAARRIRKSGLKRTLGQGFKFWAMGGGVLRNALF